MRVWMDVPSARGFHAGVSVASAVLIATCSFASANDEKRAEAIATITQNVELQMALCGIERSDSTAKNITRRMDDDDFDINHAKALALAAMAATSRATPSQEGMVEVCQKWNEVFKYIGAVE
jgi:hypothetical protein